MPGCSFSASHGWLNQTAGSGRTRPRRRASTIDSRRARRVDVRRTTPAIATSSSPQQAGDRHLVGRQLVTARPVQRAGRRRSRRPSFASRLRDRGADAARASSSGSSRRSATVAVAARPRPGVRRRLAPESARTPCSLPVMEPEEADGARAGVGADDRRRASSAARAAPADARARRARQRAEPLGRRRVRDPDVQRRVVGRACLERLPERQERLAGCRARA